MPGGPGFFKTLRGGQTISGVFDSHPLRHLYLVLSDGITGLKRGFISWQMAIFQLSAYYLVTIHSVSDSIVKPFREMRLLPSKPHAVGFVVNFQIAIAPYKPGFSVTFVTYYVKVQEVDKSIEG